MKKSTKAIIMILAFILCLSLIHALAAQPESVKSGDLSIPAHSKEDIALYRSRALSGSYSEAFVTEPSVAAPYAAGELTQDYMDCGLGYLNYVRYAAGLSPVTLNSNWNTEAQHASVVMAANNDLSHYPSQPEGMDPAFYNIGYNAASSSNIFCAYGYGSRNYLSFSIQSYMDDDDPSNMPRVGHRRWLLNPLSGMCVGFGQAKGSSGFTYSATKVFGSGQTGTRANYRYIAWPASGNFPSELLASSVPWSVTLNPLHYDTGRLNNVSVTITREADGKSWTLSGENNSAAPNNQLPYFNIDTSNRAVANCIIFHPGSKNWGTEVLSGVYSVRIDGLYDNTGEESPLFYSVDFFDVSAVELPSHHVDVVSSSGGKVSISSGSLTAGSSLSFTVSPDEGYEIAAVIIDGVSQPIQSRYDLGALSADVSIQVLFADGETLFMEHEGLLYSFSEGSLTVMGHKYQNFSGNIDIPGELWGLAVTAIADGAFEYSYAQSFTLPESIRTIGDRAFNASSHQGTFTIPAGVESIGTYAFSYMYGVTDFVIDGENSSYATIDGALYDLEGGKPHTLLNYCLASPAKEFTVPESVSLLYCTSFAGAANLRELYVMSYGIRAMTYTFYNTDLEVYARSSTRLYAQLSNELISPVNGVWDIETLAPLSLVEGDAGLRLRITNTGSSHIKGSVFAAAYDADGRMSGCSVLSADTPARSVSFADIPLRAEEGSISLFLLDSDSHAPLLPASVQNLG